MVSWGIFGDSIVFGAYDKKEGGWADRLKKHFLNSNTDVDIYNFGVSGDTTKLLLQRFEVECNSIEPDGIIISMGINDSAVIWTKNWVSPEKYEKNLKELYNKAKKFTNKVIFVGLTRVDETKTQPIPWDTEKSYNEKNVLKYNQIVKLFCKKNKILFIDMHNNLNKEDLEDGVHPNSKGHEKIFKKVKDFLVEKV